MPIKCTDWTWSETADEVYISVPLKGVRSAKADIYSDDVYIKVNYPPYFFEADLRHPIDDVASGATIGNGVVEFKLIKHELGVEWGELVADGTKDELRARREDAQLRSVARQKTAKEAAETEIRTRQSAAVQKQMNLEAAERKSLADLKDVERKKMADAVDKQARERAEAAAEAQKAAKATKAKARPAGAQAAAATGSAASTIAGAKASRPARSRGKIEVSFTPRAFATAARESHLAEEEEWLAKQMAARKAVADAKKMCEEGGVENDPLWLKDKGNGFFKAGDFKSAINAFTAGISLDPKNPSLFSNRAAAHMRLNDFYACAIDCSKALSLLMPPVDGNKRSRLIAFSRRAAALAALGDHDSSLRDLQEALALDPENESLLMDKLTIQAKMSVQQQQEQAQVQAGGAAPPKRGGEGPNPNPDADAEPRSEFAERMSAAGLTMPLRE